MIQTSYKISNIGWKRCENEVMNQVIPNLRIAYQQYYDPPKQLLVVVFAHLVSFNVIAGFHKKEDLYFEEICCHFVKPSEFF